MKLSCSLGTTPRVPQEKFIRKPYNKSFIDHLDLTRGQSVLIIVLVVTQQSKYKDLFGDNGSFLRPKNMNKVNKSKPSSLKVYDSLFLVRFRGQFKAM